MSYSAGLLKVDTLNVPGASGALQAINATVTTLNATNVTADTFGYNNLDLSGDLSVQGITTVNNFVNIPQSEYRYKYPTLAEYTAKGDAAFIKNRIITLDNYIKYFLGEVRTIVIEKLCPLGAWTGEPYKTAYNPRIVVEDIEVPVYASEYTETIDKLVAMSEQIDYEINDDPATAVDQSLIKQFYHHRMLIKNVKLVSGWKHDYGCITSWDQFSAIPDLLPFSPGVNCLIGYSGIITRYPLETTPFDTHKDAENYIATLRKFKDYIVSHQARLNLGLSLGLKPHIITYDGQGYADGAYDYMSAFDGSYNRTFVPYDGPAGGNWNTNNVTIYNFPAVLPAKVDISGIAPDLVNDASGAHADLLAVFTPYQAQFLSDSGNFNENPYLRAMRFDNYPSLASTFDTSGGYGELPANISDKIMLFNLMNNTYYTDNDPVFTVTKIDTSKNTYTSVDDIFDNYNFDWDNSTETDLIDKLDTLGINTSTLYYDIRTYCAQEVKVADASFNTYNGQYKNLTRDQIVQKAFADNKAAKSDQDIYGASLLSNDTAIQKFINGVDVSGNAILNYDGNQMYGEFETPRFSSANARFITTTTTFTCKLDGVSGVHSLVGKQPKYNVNHIFTNIMDQQYDSVTGDNLIDTVGSDIPEVRSHFHFDLIRNEWTFAVGSITGPPIDASGNINAPVGTTTSTSTEWYTYFGDYYHRDWRVEYIRKWRVWCIANVLPSLLPQAQIDIYSNLKLVYQCYRTAGYGGSQSFIVSDTGESFFAIQMDTGYPIGEIIGGSLRSIGIAHEWVLGHAMVIPLQAIRAQLEVATQAELSQMSGGALATFMYSSGHNEGFTNSFELSAVNYGLYNTAHFDTSGNLYVDFDPEDPKANLDPLLYLQAVIDASRLGPRLTANIRLGCGRYGAPSFTEICNYMAELAEFTPTECVEYMSRHMNSFGVAVNSNYAPAAIFILGAEKKYRKLLGDLFSYKEFFTTVVINLTQPASIEAMDAYLIQWANKKLGL